LPPIIDLGDAMVSVSAGGVTVSAAGTMLPLSAAEIVALAMDETGVVEMVNVPVAEAAAMVAVPSTVTPLAVLSLDIVTVKPPVGAGLEIVTVPVELVPPITDVGFSVRLTSVGAVTVSGPEALSTPAVAVTVINVFVATAVVPTVTEPDTVCPARIVTVVGLKLRTPFGLLERVTVRLEAIGLTRLTVPVTLLPPTTVLALSVKIRLSGRTCRVPGAAAPMEGVAVIVSVIAAATTLVAMVMDWLVLPAVNGTGVCGEADGSELVSETV
jgi:hypothetical protein